MKILFTGGGSGGHIFPIIAIARELKKIDPLIKLYFIGPKNNEHSVYLKNEGIKIKTVSSGKIRRYKGGKSSLSNFIDLFLKVPFGVIQSFFYIFFLSPDVIFSKGGYGSIPATTCGKFLRVPIFLHESDSVPGLANDLISKSALEIYFSFPDTESLPPEKSILTGNPIRMDLFDPVFPEDIKITLNTHNRKPIMLIMGGSQGSEKINDTVLEIMPKLLENFQVVHQSGLKNYEKIKTDSDFLIPENLKQDYHLYAFLNDFELRCAYQASDIIVNRAGGGSIFEIAASGKPSILIPLPLSAQNHQVKNAYSYSKNKACLVMEEDNLTPHFFLQKALEITNNNLLINEMSLAASNFSKFNSAEIIAKRLISFLKQ